MTIQGRKWTIEFLSLIAAAVIAALAILPIIVSNITFDWKWFNLLYVFGAITIVRYLFTFNRYHPLAKSKLLKILIICSIPFLFFPMLEGLHSFLEYNDHVGLQSIMSHLSVDAQNSLSNYIRIEYVFTGVTCFLGALALIIKMIRSLWRQYKFSEVV